jgi:diaminohydroxyphosphoribosylaminopyrimidine deaminase/5-amino-6-(5-phosphoribosylamino)uracil reductase
LVDELLVYLAPKLLGAGYGMADLPVLQALDLAIPLRFDAVDLVGPDLRILAQIQNRPAF